MNATHLLGDLEDRLVRGDRFEAADAERLFQCPDLVSVGVVGDLARRTRSGNRVTFGRVIVAGEPLPPTPGDAGEARLAGPVASLDEARRRVRAAVTWAGGRPVTGFALADLVALCGGNVDALATMAGDLRSAGLDGVAEVVVDQASTDEDLIAQVRAVLAGGLLAARYTVGRADGPARLALIERVCAVQAATGAVRAFAPLPRIDDADAPSTGYDDVKTVAAARLRCVDVEAIQVDWPLYGPKLAQVAITFGANDIDGVAATDDERLGSRRAPLEDILRQIRAAGTEPAERDARYHLRG